MNTTKILNWKNIVWLSLLSYGLYMILWICIDNRINLLWREKTFLKEIGIDFALCCLFIIISLIYSHIIFKILPIKNRPYTRMLAYVCILFLLNNAMAYAMTAACDALFGESGDELFRQQSIYTYGMIATFVSCIYSNAFYIDNHAKAETEKRQLEITLLKEKEVALRSQLDALKSQIDSHFMFNNFSILAELIEEDTVLAGKFLANLSKVYRYIIQNMKRPQITIREEFEFLDAYLYLIKMRYGDAIVVRIAPATRLSEGYIPPASLQLLVENAIRHNRHAENQPLYIDICSERERLTVCNKIAPLRSAAEPSTGIGLKNLTERYALLSHRQIVILQTDDTYTVELPIL